MAEIRFTRTTVDRERTALGELVLDHYVTNEGEEGYEVALDGRFLMAAHGASSERAMATLAYERLEGAREGLRVLVGGLGAGHTLRAALDLPGVAEVVVAEIGAKMEEWNRRFFAPFNGAAVDDPRVRVEVGDLAELLRASSERYDLMLLDVDNGPGDLAAEGNAGLYEVSGLHDCQRALRPGGVLAVWSPHRNPAFLAAFRAVFPEGEEIDTRAIGKAVGEPGDVIYLAMRARYLRLEA